MNDATTPDYMRVTKAQFERTVKLWSGYAGETITLDPNFLGSVIGEPITAFGSELAMLRLHYRTKVGRVAYSTNLKTWYYVNK